MVSKSVPAALPVFDVLDLEPEPVVLLEEFEPEDELPELVPESVDEPEFVELSEPVVPEPDSPLVPELVPLLVPEPLEVSVEPLEPVVPEPDEPVESEELPELDDPESVDSCSVVEFSLFDPLAPSVLVPCPEVEGEPVCSCEGVVTVGETQSRTTVSVP